MSGGRYCEGGRRTRAELRQRQVRQGESPRSWQAPAMSPSTERQLRLIRRFGAVMEAAGLPFWLFGGWGLDARLGRITREHDDIEFWVEREQGGRSKSVLVEAGAVVLPTQPEEESREYTWDDVLFSTAYFDRRETARSNSKAGGRIGTFLSSPLQGLRHPRWPCGADDERDRHARHEGAVPESPQWSPLAGQRPEGRRGPPRPRDGNRLSLGDQDRTPRPEDAAAR